VNFTRVFSLRAGKLRSVFGQQSIEYGLEGLDGPLYSGEMEFLNRPLSDIYTNQSVEIDAKDFIRRHKLSVDKVWKIPNDGPQTLLECFQLGLKLAGPNGTICGTPSTDGKYQLKTYGDMEADSMLIGSALDYYGLMGARDMIAIYSTNRYEYDAIILGGYQTNITNVALYDTLGLEAVDFIMKETQIRVVFIDQLKRLMLFSN